MRIEYPLGDPLRAVRHRDRIVDNEPIDLVEFLV
jgi:hypothetical protein